MPIRAVCTGHRVPRQRPPPVLGTHHMALRPSSVPLRVPLPSPPASSLADGPDPESDLVHAASPTVPRLLATVVTDPSFEFATASDCPPSVGGECALGTDVLEDRHEDFECFAAAVPHLVFMMFAREGDPDAPDIPTPRSYAEAITGPYSSKWQTAMDAEMASWKSTVTYVNVVPPLGSNTVDGMWIFRVKHPPGSPPAFKAHYATALLAESPSASPPFIGVECALGTDVLEDKQEDFECLATAVPRFASMLLAPEGDPDAPDIPTPRSYAEVITRAYSSQWQAAMDAGMASWKSAGTYVDAIPPLEANIVDGMWIFRVKRPPGSPPDFKAHYIARGFSQRQGVDYIQTFSPTLKMTTLRVLLHVVAQRDYELHSLDFTTAFLRNSLHEEIWQRRPPGFTGSFPAGTQWSLRRPVYGLRQVPCEWHDTLRTTLAALGFAPSTADLSLFLHTNTSLPPFYVHVYIDDLVFAAADTKALNLVKSKLQKRHTCTDLGELRSYLGLQITRDRARRTIPLTQSHMVHQVLQRFGFQFSLPQPIPLSTGHSLSAPPSDESVEPSGMGLVLGGRGPVILTGHIDTSWVADSATMRSSQGYTFSLGSGSVSWRSTRSSSVLISSREAEIYAGAMAAQELRWLTYLLTDLAE
ncbi:unnamed protein product [Closterium sp. NIES-54]